jgi:ABC-type multidrug transport system fused ATPase/permease subunit
VIEVAQLSTVVDQFSQGLETEIGPFGQNLSVGQVQRILIARALYKKPDVLVMDEATSALDPKTELQIVTGIAGLLPETISVVAAHRLTTIKDADSIYVLSNGECVERGSHSELVAENGVYTELWRPS